MVETVECIFSVEKTGYAPGEEQMLKNYAHWFQYAWRDRAKAYTLKPGWNQALPEIKDWAGTFAFQQSIFTIPENISVEGARGALMTIVPSIHDLLTVVQFMRDRNEGGLFSNDMSPQEAIVQHEFWSIFKQYQINPQTTKQI